MGVLRMPEVEATSSLFMRPSVESMDSSSWPYSFTLGPGIHRVGLFAVGKVLTVTTTSGTYSGDDRVEALSEGGRVTLDASPRGGSVSVSIKSMGHG